MKIPRDESGLSLSKRMEKLGYSITRQNGSHIRMTTSKQGTHQITIPVHKNLKIGTLNSILVEVAGHFKITKEELIKNLW